MQDGLIKMYGRKGDKVSTIKVHLSFDVPEELMQMLINEIHKAVDSWQDKVILYESSRI